MQTELSKAQAQQLLGIRLNARTAAAKASGRTPALRFYPVMIAGPNEGFMVVELGFAESNGFAIVR